MPPIEILSIWTISFLQIAVSLFSPTVLAALANLHTQRARAVANAINLHNRAQYNAALVRSRANLAQLTGDHRLPRDAKDFFPIKGENAEESKLTPKDKFVFNQDTPANESQEELPTDDNFLLDERVGASYENQNEQIALIPGYICTLGDNENAAAKDEELKISINLANEGYNPMVDFNSNPLIDIRNADAHSVDEDNKYTIGALCQCHSKLRESSHLNKKDFSRKSEPLCPICGQTLRSGHEDHGARQTVNMFEDFSPENSEFNAEFFKPAEELATEDDDSENLISRTQEGKFASSDPRHHHLHKHGFSHTHIHQHELRPIHSVSEGAIVTPLTNIVNVNQNQQGFQPTTILQPAEMSNFGGQGSSSFATIPTQIVPGGVSHFTGPVNSIGNHNFRGPHAFPMTSSGGLHIKPVIENVHETSFINQNQHIQTPSSINKGINQVQNAMVSNNHGNINQNQMAISGRESEIQDDEDLVGLPRFTDNRFSDGDLNMNNQDEVVSTFLLPNIHIDPNYPSEYPLNAYSARNIDPTKPQDRQPFVKYIEDEQKSINELLHYIERSNHQRLDSMYNHGVYNQPAHVPKILDYQSHSKNDKKEKSHHKSHLPSYPGYDKDSNYQEPSLPTVHEYAIHNGGDQYNENSYMNSENENRGYLNSDNNNYDHHEAEYPEESEENQDDQNDDDDSDNSDYEPDYNYRHRSNSHFGRNNQDSVVGARFGEINLPHFNQATGFSNNRNQALFRARTPSEFDQETQQKLISNYFETEQKNINNAWEEVQKKHQRNFENLMHSLQQNSEISDIYHEFPLGQPLSESADMKSQDTDNLPDNPEAREAQEIENQDMLTKLLENDPIIQHQIGFDEFEKDPTLGRIFTVPQRHHEAFRRRTRSLDTTQINNLLLKEKEIIEELKKYANHNQDLMMIGFIGDNLIDDLKQKRSRRKNRTRRQTKEKSSLPWKRLLTDPDFKMNMQNTLNNLGAATKSTFEYERAPLFHVQNVVGSAKDAVMAAMKIPTQQFIIPSSYQIVPQEQKREETVAAINPELFTGSNKMSENAELPMFPSPENQFGGTFQKIGHMISDNVKSGEETLEHIGDAANHAKKALHSIRYVTPRMMLRKIPSVTKNSIKQAILITPKVFDFSDEKDKVGSALRTNNKISVGHIMDAVGLSNPNSNLELEKITMQQRSPILMKTRNSGDQDDNFNVYDIQIEKLGSANEDTVGDTLNAIHEAQRSLGVTSLKELFNKIRKNVQLILNGIRSNKNNPVKKPTETQNTTPIKKEKSKDEKVGMSLIPQGAILHPFMGRVSDNQVQELLRQHGHDLTTSKKIPQNENDYNIGPILGAINPIMFERMFNESMKANNISNVTPHDVFHHDHDGHSHGKHDVDEPKNAEQVSTTMEISPDLLKPFMGKVSKDKLNKFLDEYNSDYKKYDYESTPEYIEYEEYNSENQEYTPYDDSKTY